MHREKLITRLLDLSELIYEGYPVSPLILADILESAADQILSDGEALVLYNKSASDNLAASLDNTIWLLKASLNGNIVGKEG